MMQTRHIVYGTIVGNKLPFEQIKLGKFTIGPKPKNANCIQRPSVMELDGFKMFYMGKPGRIEVVSEIYFWVTYESCTKDDAEIQAIEVDVPFLQTILSLVGNGSYYLQAHGIESNDTAGNFQNTSLWSEVLCTSGYNPVNMDKEYEELIRKMYLNFIDNAKFKNVSQIFYSAIELECVAGGRKVHYASALMLYYKAIESLAYDVENSHFHEETAAKEEIINKLMLKLNSSCSSVDKKINAVTTARNEIIKIDNKISQNKVVDAAKQMQLTEEWLNNFKEFAKLRNSKLGHGEKQLSNSEISLWIGNGTPGTMTAQKVALEFLQTYVQYKGIMN